MPARRAITKERLDQAAVAAAQAALQDVLRKTGARCDAQLRCTYCGSEEDAAEATGRTQLVFQWELSWEGVRIYAEVPMRSDKALYSGLLVPPRSWTYMLMALSLPRAIHEVGGLPSMREEGEVTECAGLAMASPAREPPKSCVLFCGGARVEHLILAHVTENSFLCTTSILPNPAGIVKAGNERVWSEGASPRKRLRGRLQWRGLEDLAAQQPHAYATAAAIAQLIAAEEKGSTNGIVQECLLMNPLEWDFTPESHLLLLWRVKAGAKWQSQVRVVTLRSLLKELWA